MTTVELQIKLDCLIQFLCKQNIQMNLGEKSALLGNSQEKTVVSNDFYETAGSKKNQQVLGIAFFSFFFFTCVEMIFAISAHSTSLLADAAAMFVDAGTYLCNLIAERWKDRPPTEEELKLPLATLEYRTQMRRLNLELFPPLVSMILLLYITYSATLESIHTLRGENVNADEDDANAGVMMFFGILFLVIDFVNMFCFSTANGAMIPIPQFYLTRKTSGEDDSCFDIEEISRNQPRLNLNMCSAWTVRISFSG